jgi:hypothetical protein
MNTTDFEEAVKLWNLRKALIFQLENLRKAERVSYYVKEMPQMVSGVNVSKVKDFLIAETLEKLTDIDNQLIRYGVNI